MEDICLKFPHIAGKVFKNVDNQTLVNLQKSSRRINNFINGEKFYWLRIFQKYCQMAGYFSEYWKKIVKNTPLEVVKKLAMASFQFSKTFADKKIGAWRPFHLAAAFGNLELYKWIEDKCGELPLLECSSSLGHCSNPLHLSADHGSLEIFKYLLKKSVHKNPENEYGVTPLHLAAKNGHFDICILLIANILTDKNPRNDIGRTPLHAAALKDYLDICELLVNNTVDKNPRDDQGATPLDLSYPFGHFHVCKFIIENIDNLDLNLPQITMERTTLLRQAAADGKLVVFKSIAENVVEKNPSDDHGYTTFHLAARLGHFDVCELIIAYVDKKNTSNVDGVTPLYEVAPWGHLKICSLIFDHTKKINVVDYKGRTPKTLAEENGHLEVAKLFEK